MTQMEQVTNAMGDDLLFLLAGLALAGVGGELFVKGVVGVARWLRIPAGIAAVTLAAFATSSPELSVSVNAALEGRPQLGLGDALGSNVVNVALILGLALVLGPIRAPRDSIRRDFPAAILVPIITAFLVLDGELSRLDGVLMLILFAVWLAAAVFEARRRRGAAAEVLGERRHGMAVLYSLAGLGLLVLAGELIVMGATGIGQALALDPFIVGATMVAIGTSIPELATTVIARWRGHEEIGLGTILGSNIFNGFFIVAIAAIIHPIAVGWREVAVGLGFGALAVVLTYPAAGGVIERRRGFLLIAVYAVYVVTLLQLGPRP
jgi:cation:H+ antiporter